MKPILFNTEMVKALLDDRKTVTRRVVKPKCKHNFVSTGINGEPAECRMIDIETQEIVRHVYPPYKSGDILYVRETWCERLGDISRGKYIYKAHVGLLDEIHQYALDQNKWRPSIHMPREAARIFLRVTDVRVERLQDIECISTEGVTMVPADDKRDPRYYFAKLWDSTIKTDAHLYDWQANPWVWVIEFERISKEDAYNA